ATGSALVMALTFPAGRTYDAAGTPETRKYRIRIEAENGATVAQAETRAVDTSYVFCPDLAAASATRIDGSCNVQQGFGVPMRVRLRYTVRASDAGDTIVIDRRVNGGSYSVAASFAAPGTGTWDDELRSEEHTSELQSREKLVCRLLLQKKKKREGTSA